jgi:extradiol dioxygenase family protein
MGVSAVAVELNHTIVHAQDRQASAEFLARILDLEVGAPTGPFVPVMTSNGVTLDFMNTDRDAISTQHYAFLVTEEEFDGIFKRVQEGEVSFYADPAMRQAGQINTRGGGRGFYFADPVGHAMEVLTRA